MDPEDPRTGGNRTVTLTPILSCGVVIDVVKVQDCVPAAVKRCRMDWVPWEL